MPWLRGLLLFCGTDQATSEGAFFFAANAALRSWVVDPEWHVLGTRISDEVLIKKGGGVGEG